jgi:hypothetical protein
MVEKKQRTEYKYDCEDLANEYSYGYRSGYQQGFIDGKGVHTCKDEKRDVG